MRNLSTISTDIRREHALASEAAGSAIEHAIRCGELLTEAKSKVEHGQWSAWLAENFPGSYRTAAGYMRLHRERGQLENVQRVADLTIGGALKALARPRARDTDARPDRPEPDPRFIPADGEGLLFDMAPSGWLEIRPSADHPGFYFLTVVRNSDLDDGGWLSGTTKPIAAWALGPMVAAALRSEGLTLPADAEGQPIMAEPWTYHEQLYGSHDEYVKHHVLGMRRNHLGRWTRPEPVQAQP